MSKQLEERVLQQRDPPVVTQGMLKLDKYCYSIIVVGIVLSN